MYKTPYKRPPSPRQLTQSPYLRRLDLPRVQPRPRLPEPIPEQSYFNQPQIT